MPKLWLASSRASWAAWPTGEHVARAVPGGLDAEELAERGHLPRHAQAADLRDVDPDEVDQPLGDQRHVLLLGVEQLAHRQRDARLLADQPEVVLVLGRERILEEEQVVLLQLLAQVAPPGSGVIRSWTSWSSSTSSPSVVRRCSNSFGSVAQVGAGLPDVLRIGRPDDLGLRRLGSCGCPCRRRSPGRGSPTWTRMCR